MIEIPLNSSPEQLFNVRLSGQTYEFRVRLNSRQQVWYLSIAQNGIDLHNGIALLGGVDIFKQYNLPIENVYVVNLDDESQDANSSNLGTSAKLFILTDEEVEVG